MKSSEISSLNKKLDKILENQKKILEKEGDILEEENKIEELEKKELKKEEEIQNSEKDALEELKELEKKMKSSPSPLYLLTKKDVVKGFIGAFIGVMSHFAFTKAAAIAPEISLYRATLLYIIAFIILIGMIYYSGFRNVKKNLLFNFLPLRATILFVVAIFTIIFVNLIFGQIQTPITFEQIYTLVSANIILAVIGAATADLIGRNE